MRLRFCIAVGGTFWCKNAAKKRIKGALFTDCFVVNNSFWVMYVVEGYVNAELCVVE